MAKTTTDTSKDAKAARQKIKAAIQTFDQTREKEFWDEVGPELQEQLRHNQDPNHGGAIDTSPTPIPADYAVALAAGQGLYSGGMARMDSRLPAHIAQARQEYPRVYPMVESGAALLQKLGLRRLTSGLSDTPGGAALLGGIDGALRSKSDLLSLNTLGSSAWEALAQGASNALFHGDPVAGVAATAGPKLFNAYKAQTPGELWDALGSLMDYDGLSSDQLFKSLQNLNRPAPIQMIPSAPVQPRVPQS